MSGVKGKSGGARPGAGRKTLKTEREIKEQLQEFLPEALKAIKQGLSGDVIFAKLHTVRLNNAWRVINKFVAGRRATEITGKEGEPITIKLIKDFIYDAEPEGDVSTSDTSPKGQK